MINLKANPVLYGIMCWWDKVEDAAMYHVKLYIDDELVLTEDEDRNTLIHRFLNLGSPAHVYKVGDRVRSAGPRYRYFVQVEAEGRDGEILDSSQKTSCTVLHNAYDRGDYC